MQKSKFQLVCDNYGKHGHPMSFSIREEGKGVIRSGMNYHGATAYIDSKTRLKPMTTQDQYPYAVIYLRSGTDSEADNPTRFARWHEAESVAIKYNRCNQDHTWNCIVAYVVDTRNS